MTTVEELLEIEEIRKIRVLYSHYFDGRDLDGLAGLFAEDAVCEFGPDFGRDWVGRDAIRENYAKVHSRHGGLGFSFMHAVTNPWIELVPPDRASGRCYLLDINTTVPSGTNPLTLLGVYVDEYRKIERRWYIARTRIDFLWPNRRVTGEE